MAGNDDRNRIAPIGRAHRATGVRLADVPRHFAVTHGLAERNLLQFLPDQLLKSRAGQMQRHVEFCQFAVEIGRKLALGFGKRLRVVIPSPGFCYFRRVATFESCRFIAFPIRWSIV